jgi:hypothetical protein
VKHGQRIDQDAIKEDPLGSQRLMDVLLKASAQNFLSESKNIWPAARTARKAF